MTTTEYDVIVIGAGAVGENVADRAAQGGMRTVITAAREVTVTAADGTETVLTARHAVAVCTGSASLLPDIPGLRESQPWTSRDATSVQRVPVSLAILGGGVVATEMATAYAGFGTEVHLIARSGLLGGEEPFAGELVAESLKELGVSLHLDAKTERVERTDADGFRLQLDDGTVVETDEFLVATGRLPRTFDLGLDGL